MPKVKPSLKEIELSAMNDRTKSIIGYCMFKHGLKHADMAKVIGVGQKAIYDRLHKPENYRLHELRAIIKKFNLTKEQIVELIGVDV